ncbi:hypothetical protein T492DRAFT_892678 [Pavlovales sp. CCMP2436]|nr:hypothetical protein T492DRAFT_892678 [Pavlovales sp. CCMP2436]
MEDDRLETPMRVKVVGLGKSADLNVTPGAAQLYDEVASRYLVRLDDASTFALQRVNIEPLGGAPWPTPIHVRIDGLSARPELNGLLGIAFSFAEERERYRVTTRQPGSDTYNGRREGEVVAIRPANLTVLAPLEEKHEDMVTVNELCYCAKHRSELCGLLLRIPYAYEITFQR